MRIYYTVLVAAATFLACNEKLLGVNGSPLTNDDNLDPADDNHDAVPSKRSLKFSDNYNERSMMPTEGVVYFFAKRALRYFDPLTGGSFDLRGSRAAAKLECKVLAILSRDELSLKETHFIVMHWYHVRHKPSKKWQSSLD
uniref:RxLR effector protein n=1 Tax=Hyaloperonospora arabidopsidis (strain Emoy2) TaxID=559515 RepID=M4B7S3_HYAAE|nr:RxLR effector candidate protein [Hyaloperonospora arabidopsidis Emoy2]